MAKPECKLVILGGSERVWNDLYRVEGSYDVMAVNDIGMFYPGYLKHWYSNHANQLHAWNTVRGFHHDPCENLHSCHIPKYAAEGVRMWKYQTSGSSGLVACFVGLGLGYEEIILCGIGWDNSPYFYGPADANFVNEANDRIVGKAMKKFAGRVKSMSGRSRELLGCPG